MSSAPAVSDPSGAGTAPAPLLDVTALTAGYDRRPVVYGVDLHVAAGEVVVLLGGNGVGKTTTLKAIAGLIDRFEGEVRYDGRALPVGRPSESVRSGISYVPAEKVTFAPLTVEENLILGAYTVSSAELRAERMQRAFSLFPRLDSRRRQRAGTMSGGEQRMLSLALALMSGPRLLLLDEPSLGLAPVIVEQIMKVVRALADDEGVAVLMVEQNVGQALKVAERGYVMRSGQIIAEEPARAMLARDDWWELF